MTVPSGVDGPWARPGRAGDRGSRWTAASRCDREDPLARVRGDPFGEPGPGVPRDRLPGTSRDRGALAPLRLPERVPTRVHRRDRDGAAPQPHGAPARAHPARRDGGHRVPRGRRDQCSRDGAVDAVCRAAHGRRVAGALVGRRRSLGSTLLCRPCSRALCRRCRRFGLAAPGDRGRRQQLAHVPGVRRLMAVFGQLVRTWPTRRTGPSPGSRPGTGRPKTVRESCRCGAEILTDAEGPASRVVDQLERLPHASSSSAGLSAWCDRSTRSGREPFDAVETVAVAPGACPVPTTDPIPRITP